MSSVTPDFELICAALTAFTPEGEFDPARQRELFETLLDDGITAVFSPGTTGEFTGLSDDERIRIIEIAIDVFGPEGVYAHVGAATSRQAVELAKRAVEAGATKLAAITPFFVTAGPSSVYDYYSAIAAAVPTASIYVYIFKDRATTDVSSETLARIADIANVAGVKISGLPTSRVVEYIAAVPSTFRVYSGNDREMALLHSEGARGVVSGISGVYPAPFIAVQKAILTGADTADLQPEIDAAVDAMGGGDLALLKFGSLTRGIDLGPLRVSVEPPSDEAKSIVSARQLASA